MDSVVIENIFLNKKSKRSKEKKSQEIPSLTDEKNIIRNKELSILDLSVETSLETENYNPHNKTKQKINLFSIDQIFIPAFLNDDLIDSEQKKKINKYNQIKAAFKNEEDAEVYLIKKEIFLKKEN